MSGNDKPKVRLMSFEDFDEFCRLEDSEPDLLTNRLERLSNIRLHEEMNNADLQFDAMDLKGALLDARRQVKNQEATLEAELYRQKAAGDKTLTDKSIAARVADNKDRQTLENSVVSNEMDIAENEQKILRQKARLAALDDLKFSLGHLCRAKLGEYIHS